MIGISSEKPVGQVATSACVVPHLRHENESFLSVEYFCTDLFDELSASAFAERTVCIQMRAVSVSMWTNGKLAVDGRLDHGTWQVHAPGHSFRAIAPIGYELVRIGLPESALTHALNNLGTGRSSSGLEFIEPGTVANPFLLSAAQEIKSALASDLQCSRLYVDSLFAAVVSHLIVRHSNLAPSPLRFKGASRGGLAPGQLKRLTQYLDDHLDEDVSLAELAALCGLSSYHLCRAFRQSTGQPPHRWQLRRRIERARQLLERDDRSVTDIAAAVGYDDPSQFAAMFRKFIGSSPTRYRRDRRA